MPQGMLCITLRASVAVVPCRKTSAARRPSDCGLSLLYQPLAWLSLLLIPARRAATQRAISMVAPSPAALPLSNLPA